MRGKNITVWFSCGVASAVAAKRTCELYGENNIVRLVNTPIAEEDEDNKRFLIDCQRWIGQEIETLISSKFPDSSAVTVWDKRKAMSFINGAPCTLLLKKEARYEWEKENHTDYHVLGFSHDEQARHNRFTLTEIDNVIPVLIDEKLTKQDCMDVILRAGIRPPAIYAKGFANANCVGCVKATSPTYWNLVRQEYPEVFASRAEQSRRLNVRLARVRGERIFLDELLITDNGNPLKSMDVECGLFCEEPEIEYAEDDPRTPR